MAQSRVLVSVVRTAEECNQWNIRFVLKDIGAAIRSLDPLHRISERPPRGGLSFCATIKK
jgi:hypothetical protein